MTPKLYMYRTLETDDSGDPLDSGVVRAGDAEEAMDLAKAEIIGFTGRPVTFRLYPLKWSAKAGILSNDGNPFDVW